MRFVMFWNFDFLRLRYCADRDIARLALFCACCMLGALLPARLRLCCHKRDRSAYRLESHKRFVNRFVLTLLVRDNI